jgi:L-ribulose-5-phosphate 3-epimerase
MEEPTMHASVESKMSRRALLLSAAMTGVLHAMGENAAAQETPAGVPGKLEISVFSKVLQWTDVKGAAAVAKEVGFDGIDLTVRPKGHVLPERVESDLPVAVETIHRAGLKIPMVSTEITSVKSPHAEAILKTASQLGIRHYRWGGLTYRNDQGIEEQLDELKPQVRALADLSREYGMCGIYHTHSGPGLVGAPIWDLWVLFQGIDPRWIAVNYDIGHATIEGGYGGWIDSSRLLKNSMKGIALKDFYWPPVSNIKRTQNSSDKLARVAKRYVPEFCTMGQGVVDFPGFFSIVKANRFSGPVQIHYEQASLGGAENGETKLRIPQQQLIAAMRNDLNYAKGTMRDLGLI